MSKTVNLSVHRNTRKQRQQRAVADWFRLDAKRVLRGKRLDGYAIVAWMRDGDDLYTSTYLQGSEHIPKRLIPEYVRSHLEQKVMESSVFVPDPPDRSA